jgi:hypothetical protein
MDLCLLPQPASIEIIPGSYTFEPSLPISLSADAEGTERIAAGQLDATLSTRSVEGVIESGTPGAHGGIILAVTGRDPGWLSEDEQTSEDGASPEAYRLTIRPDRIVVAGAAPAGLVQGVRTLIQILATADTFPCLTIDDAPALPWRGVMLDISRGRVPTLATLKTIVDVLASFKLNMFQLYMENTFAFASHPRIGEGWGAMTPEEIIALDAYCRDRAVELVPCFQSLGHHRRLLSLPEYAHLAYSPENWTLAPGEETWQLLDALYDDLLPCFTSRYVNVCCDEPFDLTGAHGTHLFLMHLQRLHEMLRARGKTMMVWDDIFQQKPEMLAEMPEDVVFLCWFYEAAERYEQAETVRRSGRRSIVCPGTSSWNSLFARLDNARGNIRGFIRDGLAAGSDGVLTTDWGDGGHPNFLAASWYGYAYGGSEGWAPGRLPDGDFDRRFARLFFGPEEGDTVLEALQLMGAACTLPGINKFNGSWTRGMFFRDPVADEAISLAPDDSIERMYDMGVRALEALAPLHGKDPERAQTLAEARLAARQIVHAAAKTRAGRRLAHLTDGDAENRGRLYAELSRLKRDLHELRWQYQQLWLARDKPEGLWLTLDLFDTAASVLDRWRAQVAPVYRYLQ